MAAAQTVTCAFLERNDKIGGATELIYQNSSSYILPSYDSHNYIHNRRTKTPKYSPIKETAQREPMIQNMIPSHILCFYISTVFSSLNLTKSSNQNHLHGQQQYGS